MKTCMKCGVDYAEQSGMPDEYCRPCQVLLGFRSKFEVDMTGEEFGGFVDEHRRKQLAEPIPFRVLRVEQWPEIEDDAVLTRSPRYNSTIDYFQQVEKDVQRRRSRFSVELN